MISMICRYLWGKNECHAHNYYISFIEMFSPVLVGTSSLCLSTIVTYIVVLKIF